MKLNSFAVLFLLAVVGIAGCTAPPSGNGGGNGAGETATGTLVLSITDQPSYAENYTAINVTISGIEVHKDGNWLSFFEGEKTVNLLELSGVKEVIGQDELEAGKYTQIRLAVSEAELVKADGSSEDVKVPSEEIKLVKSFDIADGELLELVLDFSPYSVVVAGNQYILKPVIKVLSTEEFQEKVEREANERGERERREKEVKIEQLVFPDTVEAGEEFELRWMVKGGKEGVVSHTAAHWDLVGGHDAYIAKYANVTEILQGETPMNAAVTVTAPEEEGTLYFRAHAIVDGSHYYLEEQSIGVTANEEPPSPELTEFSVEADDDKFEPNNVTVPKGSTVKITFNVSTDNVSWGGLDFKSTLFETETVNPGESTTVEFTAPQSNLIISSYWPSSNVLKAQMTVKVE